MPPTLTKEVVRSKPANLILMHESASLSLMLAVTVPRMMQRAGFTVLFLRSAETLRSS